MLIYLGTYLLSYAIAKYAEGENARSRSVWLFISFLPLVAIAGLRAPSVGIDTDYYPLPFYWYSLEMNLPDMMSAAGCEPGFSILIWILSRLTGSFNATLFIIQLLMILPIVWFCIKTAMRNLPIVVLVYECLIFPWSLNLMRQALAASILLVAFYYAWSRKPIGYILALFVSVSVHNTGLLGLAFYPICIISQMNNGKRGKTALELVAVIAIATICVLAFPDLVIKPILQLKDSYAELEGNLSSGSFNALLTVFPITVSICGFRACERDPEMEDNGLLFSLSLVMMFSGLFAPLSIVNPALSRLSEMYLVFAGFTIPCIFQAKKKTGLLLLLFALIIYLWVYCYGNASGALPYLFFWN